MSNQPIGADLAGPADFVQRHLGPRPADIETMLTALGRESTAELMAAAVPAGILDTRPLDLPPAAPEAAVTAELARRAADNRPGRPLIGLGFHGTLTPPVIRRNVLENPAWYTAYTPYQPEISQGRLEALLNFQTMVAELTGMELANASLLDEGTAAAEAMTMCRRLSRSDSPVFYVHRDCHLPTIEVVRTRAEPLGIELVMFDSADEIGECFGALVQYPGSSGHVSDPRPVIEAVKAAGGLVAVATDLLACTLLTPPGELGADLVVGTSQRFGVPLFFGGPHAAFLAARESARRTLPGRLVGVSVDRAGRPALRLALQTREQHIRREKATSNICTAQVLLAVVAGFYAVWHGPEGLTALARRLHRRTSALADALQGGGLELVNSAWFDTLSVRSPGRGPELVTAARRVGIDIRLVDDDTVGIALDETVTPDELAALAGALTGRTVSAELFVDPTSDRLPTGLERHTEFLTHPVFSRYRSETEMLRYLRTLADRDLALDRTMIPLGSCTMKLNATTEMEPVSWPSFADLHPFAPAADSAGLRSVIADLEHWLAEITGYDAVSLQPNAGSQGELAGLLAIRAWHRSRGDEHRRICLIPSSAHGTNAASAVMAGFEVQVVSCDEQGNIDLDDLSAHVERHGDELAAIMITYPSTHGVYEGSVEQVCALVHAAGGQVYVDGANLNALVGVARPGHFGADVSHLNLHKTFCIPHGGGGPGVGPIGVRAHLAPFLPGHRLVPELDGDQGAVASAPWGSAGILPIPWAYLRLMGPDGLRRATEVAVLAANYLAHRLGQHYEVLYTGPEGLVAHECIIDLRPFGSTAAEDVAKRLIDYGFHAPTMSFPVANTLMIEPTESESLAELDRFCDAMISIRAELDEVATGVWPADDNPLVNAPHTVEDLLVEEWTHPYTREQAAYPVPGQRSRVYWPPVSRIDNAFGDRHLVCSCPPIEAYAGGQQGAEDRLDAAEVVGDRTAQPAAHG